MCPGLPGVRRIFLRQKDDLERPAGDYRTPIVNFMVSGKRRTRKVKCAYVYGEINTMALVEPAPWFLVDASRTSGVDFVGLGKSSG